MVLAEAQKRYEATPEENIQQKADLKVYLDYGNAMLTMAVFAICITAPLGAIFINTLGPMWLEKSDVCEDEVFDAKL